MRPSEEKNGPPLSDTILPEEKTGNGPKSPPRRLPSRAHTLHTRGYAPQLHFLHRRLVFCHSAHYGERQPSPQLHRHSPARPIRTGPFPASPSGNCTGERPVQEAAPGVKDHIHRKQWISSHLQRLKVVNDRNNLWEITLLSALPYSTRGGMPIRRPPCRFIYRPSRSTRSPSRSTAPPVCPPSPSNNPPFSPSTAELPCAKVGDPAAALQKNTAGL